MRIKADADARSTLGNGLGDDLDAARFGAQDKESVEFGDVDGVGEVG